MVVEDLRGLGLPKNSAIVFDQLLHVGESKANDIIKRTGIHRHLVYEALRDLENRGLVKRLTKKGVAHFRLLDASNLVRRAERQHEKAIDIAKLVQQHTEGQESTVTFFESVEGVDAFTDFVLDQGKTIHLIGATISFRKVFPEVVNLWNEKRSRLGVNIKALVPRPALVEQLDDIQRFSYRVIETDPIPSVLWIFGDYIAHVLWSTRANTEIIMIKNKTLAKQQRALFGQMWESAKKK